MTGDEASSADSGLTSRASRTYAKLRRAGKENVSPESWAESDLAPTLDRAGHGPRTASVVLTSSAEDSPARMSPSPADAEDSPGSDQGSSSSSSASPRLFDPSGFSWRTYRVSSLRTAVGTSESCLERWPTSGMAWHGGFWTAASSECRSDDGGCSSSEPSLREILQPPQDVPERFSLSARAARGILRRAERRGRTLPEPLRAALEAVAGASVPTKRGWSR